MKDTSQQVLNRMIDLKYRFGDRDAEIECRQIQEFTGNMPVMIFSDIERNEMQARRFDAMSAGPINF